MTTNFHRVFELLLDLCRENSVSAETVSEKMVICVFSDMQFNQAQQHDTPWQTTHEKIVRMWQDAGYPRPPKIVYWNLKGERGAPVQAGIYPENLVSPGLRLILEMCLILECGTLSMPCSL